MYTELPTNEVVKETAEALKLRNVETILVNTKDEALAEIKKLIPPGASVNNGSSRTLEEIGFIDLLKSGNHSWNNLHATIIAEQDPVKKAELRKRSAFSDYYLGSVHALAQTGEMVIASASGSQLPPLTFTSQNIILVVGTQKITPNLQDAIRRLREYVVPLEDQRMKSTGAPGTVLAKILIMEQEPAFTQRKVRVILINEKLGF